MKIFDFLKRTLKNTLKCMSCKKLSKSKLKLNLKSKIKFRKTNKINKRKGIIKGG